MYSIKNIQAYNFRNLPNLNLEIEQNKVAIVGSKGVGKTNLLQAIYYSTYAKAYRSVAADALNITSGQTEMSVRVSYLLDGREGKAAVEITPKGKKLYINDKKVATRADFVQNRNIVLITPDDLLIINGGSADRRTFMDALLSKTSSEYLSDLVSYKRYLRMRNAYLKQRLGIPIDSIYLDSIDNPLAPIMQRIYLAREAAYQDIETGANQYYEAIALKSDKIDISYVSDLQKLNAAELLSQNRSIDAARGRTTQGIHRDDLVLSIQGHSTKDFASQGQKKSLLFALRLTESELIQRYQKSPPIMMMDDVFEKLDNQRIARLLDIVKEQQLFITDTSEDRVRQMLDTSAQLVSLT